MWVSSRGGSPSHVHCAVYFVEAIGLHQAGAGDLVVPVHEDLPSRGLTYALEPLAPETVNGHVAEDKDGVLGSDPVRGSREKPIKTVLVGFLGCRSTRI